MTTKNGRDGLPRERSPMLPELFSEVHGVRGEWLGKAITKIEALRAHARALAPAIGEISIDEANASLHKYADELLRGEQP